MKRTTAIAFFILLFTIEISDNVLIERAVVPLEEWELMIQALIIVESEGNPLATGKTNDVGILQITPVYIAEVNRILGKHIYTLEHRTDIEKSIEMFEIYQSHHNPHKDIVRAIKIHNPRAGQWYLDKVLLEFTNLKTKHYYDIKTGNYNSRKIQ